MKTTTRSQWRTNVGVAAFAILIVIALPAIAALLFLVRAALLVAVAVTALAGLVALAVSPRFRWWAGLAGEPAAPYKGLRLAEDVAIAPWHTWARLEGRVATVGVDDLAQATAGPVARVELPEVGRHFDPGETLFRAHHALGALEAAAPVGGTVVAVNDALAREPKRLNASPFADGWAVRLAADAPRRPRPRLLRGARAQEFFRGEVDRLLAVLAGDAGLPTLADGGLAVAELHRHIDQPTWERIQQSFFARRPAAKAA